MLTGVGTTNDWGTISSRAGNFELIAAGTKTARYSCRRGRGRSSSRWVGQGQSSEFEFDSVTHILLY